MSLYLCTPVWFVFADAGFAVIPRRWVVERSLAWSTAHRRLAKEYERGRAGSEAMVYWAAIGQMAAAWHEDVTPSAGRPGRARTSFPDPSRTRSQPWSEVPSSVSRSQALERWSSSSTTRAR